MLADGLAAAIRLRSEGCLARANGHLRASGPCPSLVVRRSPDVRISLPHHRLLSGALQLPPVHATPVRAPASSRRDGTRIVLAAIAALMGMVWAAQGLGAPIGGSFMIGDPFWIWAGIALIVAAIGYAAWPRLRRR
jgi:hypothetical protein